MARRSHSAGFRLHDSNVIVLISRMIEVGARTKTIERLTGANELVIRDVYREMTGESPSRGPSNYSHKHYISAPVDQFDASLAAMSIEWHLTHYAEEHGERPEPGYWLGNLFYEAYKSYLNNAKHFDFIKEGMPFERFAYLGLTLPRKTFLQWRSCKHCNSAFISGIGPEYARDTVCPHCTIQSNRKCSRCETHVPLDDGDLPPKRAPMCIACAHETGRQSTIAAYRSRHGRSHKYEESKTPETAIAA